MIEQAGDNGCRASSIAEDPASSALRTCWWCRRDGLTVDRCSRNLLKKWALHAVCVYEDQDARISILAKAMLEAGYVDADRSDRTHHLRPGRAIRF